MKTPIPQEWVEEYISTMKEQSQYFGGTEKAAALMRADHATDMLEYWRNQQGRRRESHRAARHVT